jgi:glycosyltransferase involved in cell wall biosynthesis
MCLEYARNWQKHVTDPKNGANLASSGIPREISLSLVIPCFNEEGNVQGLVGRSFELLAREPRAEVIFVNNGSSDSTGELLAELTKSQPRANVVNVDRNQGYGFGIKKGLEVSRGSIVGWTHADLQTDPLDALKGIQKESELPNRVFIKGLRTGRPPADVIFTVGMSVFESALFRTRLRDINAQPTLFSRDLLETVLEGPDDFSLDLYAMVRASESGYTELRFPVVFGPRFSGSSKWNTSIRARFRFIKRTIQFSFALARRRATH